MKKNKLSRTEKLYMLWQYFSIVVGVIILNASLPVPVFTSRTIYEVGSTTHSAFTVFGFVFIVGLAVACVVHHFEKKEAEKIYKLK